ncbi:hypothetical protein GCM10025881_07610 [Pseudolysinimonas kribbensis]|uniref:DUF2382 domain-containing protein n=1 Tax=Pseudolysinimonas kribbensis TaxID=433641 RepID=A0ABQ6K1X8_9MICO|nr:hypothetical protein GCM10025881_07610 [Pseudolysinimonas kribbensis]
MLGEEVEQIPLRHERDLAVRAPQTREVDRVQAGAVEHDVESRDAVVPDRLEPVADAELVDDVERRGVHGVAAEVAQEVGVLLEHHHVDAGARQPDPEHHAAGAAARDHAPRTKPALLHGSHTTCR